MKKIIISLLLLCSFGTSIAQQVTEQVIQLQPTNSGPIGAVKVSVFMKTKGTELVFKCVAGPLTNFTGFAWNGRWYSAGRLGAAKECAEKVDWVATMGIKFSILVNGEKIKRHGEGMISETTAEYPTGVSMFDLFNNSIYSHSSSDQQKFRQMLEDAFNAGKIVITDIQPKYGNAKWSPSCYSEISKLGLRDGTAISYASATGPKAVGNNTKEEYSDQMNGVSFHFTKGKTNSGTTVLLIKFKNMDPDQVVVIGLAGAPAQQSNPIVLAPGESFQRSFPGVEKVEYSVRKAANEKAQESLFNTMKKWMGERLNSKPGTEVKDAKKFDMACMCVRG